MDGTAQANSENNWGYQAGGLQILFYIHFDTDWYRENISLENDDFYEYLRDRRLEFEIIEPNPKIPNNIKIISDKAQKSAMGRTCCLSKP